ncbi:unnamed protein product [Rotaria sordida]|uniref:EF-hand domain-containing protein n=1 Tax=Rotaria sordida TaxID=392033 RepID=A0A815DJX3_9BILA|nr:unnamed protein product [Rotaria sordida]CAF1572792.1 unnamed protein product [Rotaria sordida]
MGSKMQHSDAAEYAFTMIDTNHDESIDFTEFVLFFGMEKKRDLDSRLEMMFEIMDTSGDEFVSYDEMVNIMQKALRMGGGTGAEHVNSRMIATEIFNMFHLDKEQNLNKKQFIDGCKNDKDLIKIFGSS